MSVDAPVADATATFAAGCFWGVERTFRKVDGVVSTRVGYTGGSSPEPTYAEVCRGRTGHAEAVEVAYDPARVSYEQLLGVFWQSHNPTTKDRQGVDFGSQYRSAIFFHGPEQEKAARASKASRSAGLIGKRRLFGLAGPARIVTEIAPASTFNEAEDYHQNYLGQRCAARVG